MEPKIASENCEPKSAIFCRTLLTMQTEDPTPQSHESVEEKKQ
jgi:hypothetical protein